MSVRLRADHIHPEVEEHSPRSCLGTVLSILFLFLVALIVLASTQSNSAAQVADGCPISERFPLKVRRWCEPITAVAQEHNLPPDLIAALILHESDGNPRAISVNGAVGLMQIMPSDGLAAEFICVDGPCFADRPTIQELHDPEFNIQYGTQMLKTLARQQGGNLRDALKAYGPDGVNYSYADAILSLYTRYRR